MAGEPGAVDITDVPAAAPKGKGRLSRWFGGGKKVAAPQQAVSTTEPAAPPAQATDFLGVPMGVPGTREPMFGTPQIRTAERPVTPLTPTAPATEVPLSIIPPISGVPPVETPASPAPDIRLASSEIDRRMREATARETADAAGVERVRRFFGTTQDREGSAAATPAPESSLPVAPPEVATAEAEISRRDLGPMVAGRRRPTEADRSAAGTGVEPLSLGDYRETPAQRTAGRRENLTKFFSDVRIREGISEAYKKITGRLPNKEQIEKIVKGAGNKISKVKVLGQPLPDFIVGAATGVLAKQLASTGLAIAGVGGFGITVGAGAAGGALSGFAREYYKQRKTIDIGETPESKSIRQRFKNESRRWSARDKTKLRNAAVRGALSGAVGGVVGGFIVDHVDWGSIAHHVPGVGAAPESPDIGTTPPTPEAGGMVPPTPGAGAAEAVTPTPSPTEIPGVSGGEVVAPTPEAGAIEPVVPTGPSAPEIPGVDGAEQAVPPSPMDIPPQDLLTPSTHEITLPAGSNPWTEVDKYLTDELGRDPTNAEIRESVARLLTQNGIVDATKIPAGTLLNMEAVNQHIGEILGLHVPIPADIASLPEHVPLPNDLDIWKMSSSVLGSGSHAKEPTNSMIFHVARILAEHSKVSVPEWGVLGDGFTPANALPAGFMLNFSDEVKEEIAQQLALAN